MMAQWMQRIRVVLVETTHPGNIGSAARAMKTMGLTHLVLVNPKHFPNAQATALASGAADVLAQAKVVTSLYQAVSGCALVIGTSARQRSSDWPQVDAHGAANLLLDASVSGDEVALVFGRESSGLLNTELDLCHYLGHVPTHPEYGSLNLAMGVQVFAYELWMQAQKRCGLQPVVRRHQLASADQLADFYEHLRQTLLAIDYLDPAKHDRFMRRLRRLFTRASLEAKEVIIMRGMLRSIERMARLAHKVIAKEKT